MREASVGHQCPECVRAGSRTVRQTRTVFGGQLALRPVVTLSIMAICVVVYVGELLSSSLQTRFGMLGGATYSLGGPLHGVAAGEWYRMVTSVFLHINDPLHILMNMWALWVVGPQLEKALGRLRFTGLFLLSGIGGSVLTYLLAPMNEVAVGASGAIFGLFGAYFVVARKVGARTGGILAIIAINLVLSFTLSGIAWQGHVGGLITGTLLAVAFAYAPRVRRNLVQGGAAAALVVIMVLATTVWTQHVGGTLPW
jgi:membrane associated rhomboid family serine protease